MAYYREDSTPPYPRDRDWDRRTRFVDVPGRILPRNCYQAEQIARQKSPYAARALGTVATARSRGYKPGWTVAVAQSLPDALRKGFRPLMGRAEDTASGAWFWLWMDGERHLYGRCSAIESAGRRFW